MDSTSDDAAARKFLKLPPKSKSPSRVPSSTQSKAVDSAGSPGSNGRSSSTVCSVNNHGSQDIPASPLGEWKGKIVDSQKEPNSPRFVCVNSLTCFAFPSTKYFQKYRAI